MTVRSAENGPDGWFFAYRSTVTSPVIRVEWRKDHKVQLFPENIARAVVNKGFARYPTEDEAKWLLDTLTVEEETEQPAAPQNAPESGKSNAKGGSKGKGKLAPPAPPPAPPAPE